MIRDAERLKARVYQAPGKTNENQQVQHFERTKVFSHLLDDDYMMVASHIEDSLIKKIEVGGYVDFAKLLPKDRVMNEEDTRMEMINKGGLSFWVPISDREKVSINSLDRWDSAFRVYMKIFTQFDPDRAAELVEYCHVIHSIVDTYAWHNVYKYDREFRIHMERHPERNWGIILYQAWAMCLKERVNTMTPNNRFGEREFNHQSGRKKICYRFNRGKCTYGFMCKFEHHCGVCNKFGHGSHNCRRVLFYSDKDNETGDARTQHRYQHDRDYKDKRDERTRK